MTNTATGHNLFEQTYTLAADGQRDSVVEKRWDSNGTVFSKVKVSWAYDGENRLVTETRDADPTPADTTDDFGQCNAAGTTVVSDDYTTFFTLDLAGNRVKLQRGWDADGDGKADTGEVNSTSAYTYNQRDQLTADGPDTNTDGIPDPETATTYLYNANGSTTTVTHGSDLTTYTWDLRNRMTGATVNGTTTTYGYDSEGIRVSEATGSSATYYLNDKSNPTGYSQIIEEKSSLAGAPSLTYVIGNDVIAQATTSGPSYYLCDGHGSVRGLADANGGFIAGSGYEYDAFGTGLNFTIAGATSHLLYAGEAADAVTGMYYLRARFYNPSIDRFNSFDPAENDDTSPQSLQKYLYASGDPVNLSDPSGFTTSTTEQITVEGIQSRLNSILQPALRQITKRAVKKIACEVAEDLAFQGVYIILMDGIPYVGQSVDVARRLGEWGRKAEVTIVGVIKIIPGIDKARAAKFVREFVENFLLQGIPK